MSEKLVSTNPVTNEVVWQGFVSDSKQIQEALTSAAQAFEIWSERSLEERIAILKKYEENLKSHANELAELISKETGKPLWESLTEVSSMAGKVPLSIEAFHKRTGVVSSDMPGKKSFTRFKPHGVVAVIGPYNFPGHLPNGHIVPAILAGNTVVFKPSSLTPAVAEMTVKLWHQAGLPQGVLSLVQGGAKVGQELIESPILRGLFFTGSTRTGQIFLKKFAEKPEVILALEMGGNNPLIVTDVKDLKAASYLTIQSAYITAGQRCTCARRLVVPQGEEGDRFLKQLVSDIGKIRVGFYQERPEPFMGSVISKSVAEDILQTQENWLKAGGKVLLKSVCVKEGTALLSPGLIDVTSIKDRQDEEVFGPLLQVIRVKDFAEALTEANNTQYGLAAGLFSDSEDLYREFFKKITAGVVNWNQQLTGASSAAPFGGAGLSGNHRPGAFFAADYCAWPVASLESYKLQMPEKQTPGFKF